MQPLSSTVRVRQSRRRCDRFAAFTIALAQRKVFTEIPRRRTSVYMQKRESLHRGRAMTPREGSWGEEEADKQQKADVGDLPKRKRGTTSAALCSRRSVHVTLQGEERGAVERISSAVRLSPVISPSSPASLVGAAHWLRDGFPTRHPVSQSFFLFFPSSTYTNTTGRSH